MLHTMTTATSPFITMVHMDPVAVDAALAETFDEALADTPNTEFTTT